VWTTTTLLEQYEEECTDDPLAEEQCGESSCRDRLRIPVRISGVHPRNRLGTELRMLYESLLGMIKDELGGHGDPADIEKLSTEMDGVKEVDPEPNVDSKGVDEHRDSPGERKQEDGESSDSPTRNGRRSGSNRSRNRSNGRV
jgi:hypothetical protein